MLDSGPLGQLSHADPSRHPEIKAWFDELLASDLSVVIPEIADFEVRRSLILEHRVRSLERLDQLAIDSGYLPITTECMRLAARLWAQSRRTGRSVGDPKELNADVILAAQATESGAIIATDNVGHLGQFVEARPWATIKP